MKSISIKIFMISFMLLVAASARADLIEDRADGKQRAATTGRHVLPGGTGPTGNSILSTQARAGSMSDPKGPTPNPYTPATGSASLSSNATGEFYNAKANADIKWSPGVWDTSPSSASVTRINTQAGDEFALAVAHIADPADYTLFFDPAFTPEIIFSLMLESGLTVAAAATTHDTATASISGIYATSLLVDPLWNFSWVADSSSPSLSSFTFHSNPVLGLDDNVIHNQFLSSVISSGGIHTLSSDFTISASLFPQLPLGVNQITYQFGGEADYLAQAQTVPEPTTITLVAIGTLGLLSYGWRQRKRAT
ncbi:PEP-CTERM sorting domain-containing protein [Nitrosospira lacus]|nr:PEP-CTERM sorting domain-containing protein [Nitrosospira lacus]